MFDCERLSARLTAPSCAARWKKAAERLPDPSNSLSHCRGCPIGASHAGVAMSSVEAAADEWRMVCCRCLRQSDRLIRGRLCVSCYNREREVKVGRNGKGGRPLLTDRLKPVSVAITTEDGVTRIVTAESATGAVEIMVQAAKTAKGRLVFGPAPGSPAAEAYRNGHYDRIQQQMDLFNSGDDPCHTEEAAEPYPPTAPA